MKLCWTYRLIVVMELGRYVPKGSAAVCGWVCHFKFLAFCWVDNWVGTVRPDLELFQIQDIHLVWLDFLLFLTTSLPRPQLPN